MMNLSAYSPGYISVLFNSLSIRQLPAILKNIPLPSLFIKIKTIQHEVFSRRVRVLR